MPTQHLQIPTPDGLADAFAAFPDGGGRHPGVLLYSDAFGLRPAVRAMARELAGHGYYVLVPHLYYRHGPAPVIELPEFIGEAERPAVFDALMPLLTGHVGTDRAARDAAAYLAFLGARPEVGPGPFGVTGYCIGALLALRTAAAHPDRVAAVAGFHPAFVVTDAPDSPHRVVPGLAAEVHLGLAEGDMSPEIVRELGPALGEPGPGATYEVYPDTRHGFTMADTDAFSASGSRRHWDRLVPLLRRTLTGG
ncbi:dienelactone hydrolase family protein [Streptomyces sp. NPDC002564]|uniref:dienelactone hydrolase family protein n=1 Tax=Streptomyces sp. NPDC002564 TaxID=3364649 RepID=UPI00367C6C95